MTKSQFINRLCSKSCHLSPSKASRVVDAVLEQMSDSLALRKRIEIRGFGSFIVKRYANARVWNPKTKKEIGRTTQSRIRFKVSKIIVKRLTRKVINCIL